ncbi:MAG: hypothetical protein N2C14_23220 [Planctomycetales bacterium]
MHAILLVVSVCLTSASSPDSDLRITPVDGPARVEVVAKLSGRELEGLKTASGFLDAAGEILTFRLINKDGRTGPPIFGTYRTVKDRLIFAPTHGLVRGNRYRAVLSRDDLPTRTRDYLVPLKPVAERPRVVRVYPTADALPANQLKFYVYFSKPMRQTQAIFDHIELLNDQGDRLPDVWRRTELWSDDAKRLTLWIHPGRVKRGVNLREEEGPVLHPMRRYSLRITTRLKDEDGATPAEPFLKFFRTVLPDRRRPAPRNWTIHTPRVGDRSILSLAFGEPLDHAMLSRFLEVYDDRGRRVSGRIKVEERETAWRFVPDSPWRSVGYRIQVDGLLEDLAGNTPLRLFDSDLSRPVRTPPRLSLGFQPRKDGPPR